MVFAMALVCLFAEEKAIYRFGFFILSQICIGENGCFKIDEDQDYLHYSILGRLK